MIDERCCRRLATTLNRNEDRMVQTPLSKPSPDGVWERDKQLLIHVLLGQLRVGPIRICGLPKHCCSETS